MTVPRIVLPAIGAMFCLFACVAVPKQASAQFIRGGDDVGRRDRPASRDDDTRGHPHRGGSGIGLGIGIGRELLQQQGDTPLTDTKKDTPKKPKQVAKPKGKPNNEPGDKPDGGPTVAKSPDPTSVDTSAMACAHDPNLPYDDGQRLPIKGCCCCVEKLSMKFKGGSVVPGKKLSKTVEDPDLDPVEIERDVGAQFGHEFKVNISYQNKLMPPGKSGGQCVLRWFEKSNNPPQSNINAGVTKDQWSDIGLVVGHKYPGLFKDGTLGPWKRRDNACPLRSASVELTDKPAVFYGHGRTLEFDIIVESAPSCSCKHESLELKAKQVLDDGPDNGSSKFYGPDGKPMQNNHEAQGSDRPLPKPQPAPAGTDATPKK